MKLIELIKDIAEYNSKNPEISDIEIDSRKIKEGGLFIAIRGEATDGHRYIDKAVANGAKAIVCEEMPAQIDDTVAYVKVDDTNEVAGRLATRFYGEPTKKLKLVGVTGTNGKTTIATLLYRLFREFGHKVGLVSTVANYIDGEIVPTEHTTPDPITLNKLLKTMADRGCEYVFMEVSSHAVSQRRIGGLHYVGGIFTNLTRDHLDYHKTVANYLKAKKRFFDDMPKESFSLVNVDDKNGLVMTQNTKSQVCTYSLRQMADFKGKILETYINGMLLEFNRKEFFANLIGHFNAYNLLAVFGTSVLLGKSEQETLVALSTLTPVSGRFETIHSSKGYTAVVDYAHTPDALVNVLDTIKDVSKGRVITVVGAGGNRDKGKRPIMAMEAARRSDILILTSDNPRDEDPFDILNDMHKGLTEDDKKKTLAIEDRRDAIRTACFIAEKGDIILVAGKGHETYQEVKGVKYHFDDKEELKKNMK